MRSWPSGDRPISVASVSFRRFGARSRSGPVWLGLGSATDAVVISNGMEPMTARTYRADVDGLRAVAIVLVVLFHASSRCPGGFVGVDVFFVISGFLITGLLLDEQCREEFRLVDFWIRRVRRLLPAATLMVLATLVAGFFVMLPDDYEDLAKSAIAQQLLASNVHFVQKSGYFDGSSELMPLLHTWSLAVEEQFYVG